MVTIEATKSREMLMRHLGMAEDFAGLVEKVTECKASGKFQPALDYVITDMATKPAYGNALSKVREHPADLISTETSIKNTRYTRILNEINTAITQVQQFAAAHPNPMQWRNMCAQLEDFMDRAKEVYTEMEQTALSYMGGVFALSHVQEGFREKYNAPLDREGADGKSASTRLFKLKRAASTMANDAQALRNALVQMYATQYTAACQQAGIARADLDIPRPIAPNRAGFKVDNEPIVDVISNVLSEYD